MKRKNADPLSLARRAVKDHVPGAVDRFYAELKRRGMESDPVCSLCRHTYSEHSDQGEQDPFGERCPPFEYPCPENEGFDLFHEAGTCAICDAETSYDDTLCEACARENEPEEPERMRRNSDESIRERARRVATRVDVVHVPEIATGLSRLGLSPWFGPTERVLSLLRRVVGENEASEVENLQSIARLLAWPLTPEDPKRRPWAWDELSHDVRACALVCREGDHVVLGVAQPNSASPWVQRYRENLERSRTPRDEDEAAALHRLMDMPPVHPGTCWVDLAYPEGGRPAHERELARVHRGEVELEGAAAWESQLAWVRDNRRARFGEPLPLRLREWVSVDPLPQDRVRLSLDEVRFVLVNVLGVDFSSYEEVTGLLNVEGSQALTPRWVATWSSLTRSGHHPRPLWWTHFDLLRSVMPPSEQGIQPENATGQGWAIWAAQRLVQSLEVRQVSGKKLEAFASGGVVAGGDEGEARARWDMRNLIDNVTPREHRTGHFYVWIAFRGSVARTSGARFSGRWERIHKKSIRVEFRFPIEMIPVRDLGSTDLDENGIAIFTMGYGDHEPYKKAQKHAEWSLMGIEKLVKSLVHDFFPGMKVMEKWVW